MPQVRDNPLPVGRYWVVLIGDQQIAAWDDWSKRNASTVKIESSEYDPGEWTLLKITPNRPPANFVIFNVLAPTKWEGPGFPNTAGSDVHSSSDTVQRPDPEPEPTVPEAIEHAIAQGALWLGAIYLGGKIIEAVINRGKK